MNYEKRLKTANDFAGEISREDWVRAVLLGGSTVDKTFRPDSDIDISVITEEPCEGDYKNCKIIESFAKDKYQLIDDNICFFCGTEKGLIEGIIENFNDGTTKPYDDFLNRTEVLYEKEKGVYENFRKELSFS